MKRSLNSSSNNISDDDIIKTNILEGSDSENVYKQITQFKFNSNFKNIVTDALLQKGCNIQFWQLFNSLGWIEWNYQGKSLIWKIIKKNDKCWIPIIDYIFKNNPFNFNLYEENSNGESLLSLLILNGLISNDVLNTWLDKDVGRLYNKDNKGNTVLFYAVKSNNIDLVKEWLKKDSKKNFSDYNFKSQYINNEGNSALMMALLNNKELFRIMIENINQNALILLLFYKNNQGNSIMSYFATNKDLLAEFENMMMLLYNKTNKSVFKDIMEKIIYSKMDDDGNRLDMVALLNGNEELALSIIKYQQMNNKLVLLQMNNKKQTSVLIASYLGAYNYLEKLHPLIIRYYANSNIFTMNDVDDYNAILYAIIKKHYQILDFFIKNGYKTKAEYFEDIIFDIDDDKLSDLILKLVDNPKDKNLLIKLFGEEFENENNIITNEMVEKAIKDDDFFSVFKLVSAPKEINQVDFSKKNKDGDTLLSLCVNPELKNCLPLVFFKSKEIWNIRDKTGLTPIMNMILKDNSMLYLIDINNFPDNQLFILFSYAVENNYVHVSEAILNKMYPTKYDDTYKLSSDLTFLMLACQNGDEDIVKILLDNNSQHINILTRNNENALMIACKYSNAVIVKELLEYKANIYQISRGGMTALMIACDKEPRNITIGDVEIVEHLLKYSDEMYINEQNFIAEGKNALMFAVQNNNLQIVRCLLKTGRCDVYIKNNRGKNVWEMIDEYNDKMKEVFKPYFETEQVFKKIKLDVELNELEKSHVSNNKTIEIKNDERLNNVNQKGLQIGGSIIKKISGPMSITILVPKNNQIGVDGQSHHINDYQHQKITENSLPVIILFGDNHFSTKGMCKDCYDNEKCCAIYSDYFLKILDSLYANDKTPIDFYIEVQKPLFDERDDIFDKIKKKINKIHYTYKKNTPLPYLQNFRSCYIRELRNTEFYKKKCPTKKVRWHGIDARFSNSYEGIFENMFTILFNYMDSISSINKLYSLVKNLTPDELIFYFNQLADFISEPEMFIAKMFNLETNPVLQYNSLIYKQVSKMRPPLNNYGWWYKMFCDLYARLYSNETIKELKLNIFNNIKVINKYLLIKISIKDSDNIILTKICHYISYTIENKLLPKIKTNSDNILDRLSILYFSIIENIIYPSRFVCPILFVRFSEIFLDMYFITRVFKFPENGNPSVLTLGYFGDSHSNNITHFLTNISQNYNIEYIDRHSNKNEDNFRCLDMPDINFNSTIFNFKLLQNLSSNSQRLRDISQVVKEYEENQKKRKEKAQRNRLQVLKVMQLKQN
jgi:ankyrin repeat protein